jgi:hypothetical protein
MITYRSLLTLEFLGDCWRYCFYFFSLREDSGQHKHVIAVGCFSIAVHSFVDFNLQVTANAQIFLALAAIATLERNKSAE